MAALAAVLARPGPAVSAPKGFVIEPPPAQFAAGPTQSGRTTERVFEDAKELQAFCNAHLGRPSEGFYEACYVPRLDLVAVPGPQAWPDAASREALREHEWAHARGWRHPLRLRTASRRR